MKSTRHRILLIGTNERAALSVTRSLGQQNTLNVVIARFGPKAPACYSRWCQQSYQITSPESNLAASFAELKGLIRHEDVSAVLPINDQATELVYHHYQDLKDRVKILGPKPDTYYLAQDKYALKEIATASGIDYPETICLSELEQLQAYQGNYPVYLKPRFSAVIYRGRVERFGVLKARSAADMRGFVRDHLGKVNVLVQREAAGEGIGLNVFAGEGQVIDVNLNQRLHEPGDGGGSSYRRSMPVDDQLRQVAATISRELDFTGVMMIEMKRQGDRLTLMEINPRFWGSLPLTVESGHDFPAYLVEYILNDNTRRGHFRPIYARNLLKDLKWTVRHLSVPNVLQFGLSPLRVLLRKEVYDVERISDPLAGIAQFGPIFNKTGARLRLGLRHAWNHVIGFECLEKFSPDDDLIFLCRGNINRSAFAEHYLRQIHQVESRSCSLIDRAGRLCSDECESLAKQKYGVDMRQHRSTPLAQLQPDLTGQEVIIVFDRKLYTWTQNKLGKCRVYLLEPENVEDPYGHDRAFHAETFERIKRKIDEKLVS